jgi:RimJ/RimL family protein N-acetyltransferase
VMLNDSSRSERLKLLRSHGLNRGKIHYQHELAGNNYRLSNLLSAVACAQLEQWQRIVAEQDTRNEAYFSELSERLGLEMQRPIQGASDVVWAVGVRLNAGLFNTTRDTVISRLKDRGIETRPGFYPASTLAYNKKFLLRPLPVSESIAKEIVVLPCSPTLGRPQIQYVVECLREVLNADGRSPRNLEIIDLRSAPDADTLIQDFLGRLGSGRASFRYFDKRPPEVVRTHDMSLMLVDSGTPIAYGHIETENCQSWLGIAVTEQARSGGYGKVMMTRLLARADNLALSAVNLKVDGDNVHARGLYESFGFRVNPALSSGHAVHMVRCR